MQKLFLVPTSEFSPTDIDMEAKKLFDESDLSPIKPLPNTDGTEFPERMDFEEDVNMTEEMEVAENLEKITIRDEKEDNPPVVDEVSQKIIETSLKVMAECNPQLEELKEVIFKMILQHNALHKILESSQIK